MLVVQGWERVPGACVGFRKVGWWLFRAEKHYIIAV